MTSHPNAAEVYDLARKRMPRISLGTVYRNLELLASDGLIQKLEQPGAESRFDADLTEHTHVRCMECGRVDDAPGISLKVEPASFTAAAGYDIIGHHLEFVGICPACRKAGKPTSDRADRRLTDKNG